MPQNTGQWRGCHCHYDFLDQHYLQNYRQKVSQQSHSIKINRTNEYKRVHVEVLPCGHGIANFDAKRHKQSSFTNESSTLHQILLWFWTFHIKNKENEMQLTVEWESELSLRLWFKNTFALAGPFRLGKKGLYSFNNITTVHNILPPNTNVKNGDVSSSRDRRKLDSYIWCDVISAMTVFWFC